MSNSLWPPNFTLKKHHLARYVRFSISIHKGLEITVPLGFNEKKVPAILEANKQWIVEHIKQLQRPSLVKPDVIDCLGLSETWRVIYMKSTRKPKLFVRPDHELVVVGQLDDEKKCIQLLIQWLYRKAQLFLTDHLSRLSEQTGLKFNKLTLRNQKTRWGSCSAEKNINLNFKLIFLPHTLIQHVLLHELCHTRHMNHSKKFWNELMHWDQACQANRRALRQGGRYVPDWL